MDNKRVIHRDDVHYTMLFALSQILRYTYAMEKVFAVDIKTIFTPAASFPTIGSMVNVLFKNSLVLAGIIALALLIFGGFGVIVSAGEGDAKNSNRANKQLQTQ